ncbi:MAG: hypothetical protein NDI94_02220 [Candidatus Woesearchaeota archaeon]|nr:hypothetical protein [Candidatus Woesearchaeota archaeon]
MKKTILFMLVFLMPLVLGANSHVFVVNKYILDVRTDLPPISIQPIVSEALVSSCSPGNFSFILKNPSLYEHTYSFDLNNFKGVVYHIQQLTLKSKESRQINLKLQPDCGSIGRLYPYLTVTSGNQKANLQLVMDVSGADNTQCRYYFSETECSSPQYIRIMQGSSATLNLKEWFYDPDKDDLTYSVESSGVSVKISEEGKAVLRPRWDYIGAEEVVFKADDEKGGIASSRVFYVHVYPNGRSYLQNFLYAYFLYLLVGFLLFVILLIILASILRS